MHDAAQLAYALAALQQQPHALMGLAYRSVELRHFSNFAQARPLFAAGGGSSGSRYILPNGPRALYIALDFETAYREGNQRFFHAASHPASQSLLAAGGLRPLPVVVLGIALNVSRLLNLCDAAVRQSLGIQATAELVAPWNGVNNPPTQLLGDTVFQNGFFEGLRYPSARHNGHDCLVVFPDRLQAQSFVDFSDAVTSISGHLP